VAELLVRGGRIFDPASGVDLDGGGILIQDGLIAKLLTKDELSSLGEFKGEVLDASGKLVMPGFIDLHVHLRTPGQSHKETLESGLRAAVAGGFTAVCCMPNTEPPLDRPDLIRGLIEQAEELGLARLYPAACISQAREGTRPSPWRSLLKAGARLFTDDGSDTADAYLLRTALAEITALGGTVAIHAEEPTLSRGGWVHQGPVADELGLLGIPASSEAVAIARAAILALETESRVHILHLSTRLGLKVIRALRSLGAEVTTEVTPHHLLLTDQAVRKHLSQAKVNPPLRERADREAMVEGLAQGEIEVIASDHAPHAGWEKEAPIALAPFGFSGLETSLGLTYQLVREGRLSLARWVEAQTAEPAKLLGLYDPEQGALGKLAPRAAADLTIFDPQGEWEVEPARFYSKGKNTPFVGMRLTGRSWRVVVRGKVIIP